MKVIYSFFLGIMLSLFVGLGIGTFYAEPVAPAAPEFGYVGKEGLSQEQQAQQTAFEKSRQYYDKHQLNPYNRNVSIIALAAAVVFVAIGLLIGRGYDVLSNGALLGGVFTLIYSLGRAIAANNSAYGFVAVSIGLAVVLFLGYLRFIRQPSTVSH